MSIQMRFSYRLLFYTILILLVSCSQSKPIKYELYFGLSKPDSTIVTQKQWNNFQQTVIAKEFEGFNVIESTGYYKGMAEPSKLVTIIDSLRNNPKITKIAKTYSKMFNQESVMVIQTTLDEWNFIVNKY